DNSDGSVCRVDEEWVLAVLVSGKRKKNVLLVLAGSTVHCTVFQRGRQDGGYYLAILQYGSLGLTRTNMVYLATIMDPEFKTSEDFSEIEIPQPLPIASSRVPSSDDLYLIVGQAYTPTAIDTEFEPEELHPPAARTKLPSSDHTPTSSDLTQRYLGKSELVKDIEDECLDLDIEGGRLQDEGPRSKEDGKRLHLSVRNRFVPEQQRVEETFEPRPPVRATWLPPSGITIDSRVMAESFLAELGA
nr:hypothetical protein [Tanacetum cinerariifolium]